MVLQPATTIRLIKGVNFKGDYKDVILFDSAEKQSSYFMGLAGKNYPANSYQREGKGYVKLSEKFEYACECSYMMFRNANHENRWWYAFVTDVEYINEVTVGIHFSLDIMQSYMFNWTLGDCFVEREHSSTDNVGDNLIKENLFYGPYVYDQKDAITVDGSETVFNYDSEIGMDDMSVVIAYNPSILNIPELVPSVSQFLWKENMYNGVYQGINFIVLPFSQKTDNIDEVVELLDAIFGLVDIATFGGVMSCYMMPTIFIPEKNKVNWHNKTRYLSVKRPTHIETYIPKNNKLFTYPYVALNLTNHRTEGADYAFEHFVGSSATIGYEGNLSLNPSCMAFPVGYKGKPMATEEGVSIDAYPLATWGADGVTEWISNNLFKSALSIGLAAGTGGASAFGAAYSTAVRDPVGALSSYPGVTREDAIKSIGEGKTLSAKQMDKYATNMGNSAMWGGASYAAVDASIGVVSSAATQPGQVHGVSASELMFGHVFGLFINPRIKTITKEYAMIIDDYFTKYGYATNEVKTPNLKSRPKWNYVRLREVQLNNISCPMNVVREICNVFERGVTFWRSTAVIGDYSANNSV